MNRYISLTYTAYCILWITWYVFSQKKYLSWNTLRNYMYWDLFGSFIHHPTHATYILQPYASCNMRVSIWPIRRPRLRIFCRNLEGSHFPSLCYFDRYKRKITMMLLSITFNITQEAKLMESASYAINWSMFTYKVFKSLFLQKLLSSKPYNWNGQALHL